MTVPDSTPIADRVRFWEEQDKINQELIPRVIRQHELLTAHIADHDNLPLVAGNAISEALAEAREEQQRHYDAALELAKQELQEQYAAALEAAKQEQQQQYNAALEAARQEQRQQYDAAKTAINDEAQANLERAVTTLGEEWRKTRNILIGITAASGVIAVAAVIVGILI
jgi:transketolase